MTKLVLLFLLSTYTSCLNTDGFLIQDLNSYGEAYQVVDHSIWDNLLKMYVNDAGDVNYNGFKNDVQKLDNYITYLSKQVPSKDWNKDEKLAYFINVYNANTIKLIIDNYPIKSIKDINNPWSKNLIKIGDKNYSLSDIEHDILRKMDEPRIHFAINCASVSCPKLLNVAYTSENVETLLENSAKEFIADTNKNQISKENLQLSKIFDWYKKDFTINGSLIDYINKYSQIQIDSGAKISYLRYDWNLNEQH